MNKYIMDVFHTFNMKIIFSQDLSFQFHGQRLFAV